MTVLASRSMSETSEMVVMTWIAAEHSLVSPHREHGINDGQTIRAENRRQICQLTVPNMSGARDLTQ